jgi:penicillin-binding protein 1A
MKKVTGGGLPAKAWSQFMIAAHEGVPVANLPGNWNGRIFSQVEDILRTAGENDAVAAPSQNGGYTASIDAPVPPGDVGAQPARPIGSIMDIIMGN